MNRITPEEVVAAYAKTGLVPVRARWAAYDEKRRPCGCAITALLVAAGNDFGCIEADTEYEPTLGLNADYEDGFVIGFDTIGEAKSPLDNDWQQGFHDGRSCAAAVFGE